MFQEKTPVSSIPIKNDVQQFLPLQHMRVVMTQNLDKCTGVVNSQLANIVNNENNTLVLQFPNGKTTFTYPVTTTSEDRLSRVHYAFNPAYSMMICKTQGANIKKLIVWFDCPTCPKGCDTWPCPEYETARISKSWPRWLLTNAHQSWVEQWLLLQICSKK